MKKLLLPIIAVLLLAGCGKEQPEIDIWDAAGSGDLDALQKHIDYGTDLNDKERGNGGTPLIVAAFLGRTAAAKLLIENGANLEVKNNDGSTPLHVAAFFAHPDVVTLLLESGADINARDNLGQTPLDIVSSEWTEELEQIYNFFAEGLQVELDLERIRAARIEIAEILRQHGNE